MTKRFIFSVAAIAIMLVSCSQNDMEVVNIPTSDAISLSPSTAVTRAGITYKSHLESGFSVYALTNNPTNWYSEGGNMINGIKHHFVNGKWNFDVQNADGIKWPTNAADYPITFYAFYPMAGPQGMDVIDNGSVSLDITIQEKLEEQIDIVSAKNHANVKPATASLSLNFNHILSKVNFAVTNTYTHKDDSAFVQAVGFVNVYQKNVFDVMTQKWTVNGQNELKDFNYFNWFVPGGAGGTQPIKELGFDSDASLEAFYTANTNPTLENANMMLLPQTPDKIWVITKTSDEKDRPGNDEAHVRVMYRYQHNEDENFIGFKNAQNHPNIENSITHKTYTGPLYVYAVFTYVGTWEEGYGYKYNLPLPGNGGGRLYDDYLYDDKGNRTDLLYPGGEIDKPVITDDDYIHLIPIVTTWDDLNPENVQY